MNAKNYRRTRRRTRIAVWKRFFMRCWPYAVVGQSFSIGVAALSGTLAPSFWLWQTITVFGLAFFIAGLSWIATAFIVPKIPEPDDEEVSP